MNRRTSIVIQLLIIIAGLVVVSGCGSKPPGASAEPASTESIPTEIEAEELNL